MDVSRIPKAETIEAAARGLQTLDNAEENLESIQKEFNERPVVTFKHTWNRSDEGSDYSSLVLAADGQFTSAAVPLAPLTLLMNVSLSLNHDPDGATDQDTVRDYGIDGSLAKSIANPLRLGTEAESAQRMEMSLTARFARQKDTNADIGIAQGRMVIPLVRGFSLSLALNYNTRTETDSEDEVRVSASVEFNGDTFASLSNLQSLLAGVH